jgi:hypothetical protein
MSGIREITPEQWAVLVKVLGQYATGAPFRPVFLRQVRGVVHRILALRTEAGAYSDKPNARRARLQAGLDPKTFEVIDQESFGIAVSRAVEAVGRRADGKSQAGSHGETSSGDAPEGSGKYGDGTAALQTLTLLGTDATERALSRAIKRRLGPTQAPLPDPKSLYPQPARSPQPQKENSGSSGCQQKLAGISRYTNCS